MCGFTNSAILNFYRPAFRIGEGFGVSLCVILGRLLTRAKARTEAH